MFTNNYLKYRDMMFFDKNKGQNNFVDNNGSSFYGLSSGNGSNGAVGDIGANMGTGQCNTMPGDKNTSYSSLYPGIYFGSGSTAAAKTDYKLESAITSGLKITSQKPTVSSEGDKYFITSSFIVTNTTDSEINIYELGVFTPVAQYPSGMLSDLYYHLVLMERSVLSNPITIPAGESRLVSYKLTFNQTLNVE